MEKGYIQVYTGNGKGKTTAALGLSLRAVCAGKKVFFGQFIKGMDYSELNAYKYLPGFKMEQFGLDHFINDETREEDVVNAEKGLRRANEILKSGMYDIVVLDEINIALYYNLISVDDVKELLNNKPENVEMILTGRYAKDDIINMADLVTEMKEVKHYFEKGVMARKGIEN